MPEIRRARRYYLGMRLQAAARQDWAAASVWQHKQEAEPGTALVATFPHRSVLVAIGYSTTEDLDGADAQELIDAGLSKRQATDVIGALS